MENNSLGAVIKKIRKSLNITQKELGQLTKFSQNTISNHENGNRSISLNDLISYSNSLKVKDYTLSPSFYLKLAKDLEEEIENEILNNIESYTLIFKYVSKAYYTESDIYYSSLDREEETLKIFNILNTNNTTFSTISYELILDLYKQLLSRDSEYYKNTITPRKSLEQQQLYNVLMKFQSDYLNFAMNEPTNANEIQDAIEKTYDLEKQSKDLGELMKKTPNYIYDHVKGKPMHLVYTEKYPEDLSEARDYLLKLLENS